MDKKEMEDKLLDIQEEIEFIDSKFEESESIMKFDDMKTINKKNKIKNRIWTRIKYKLIKEYNILYTKYKLTK